MYVHAVGITLHTPDLKATLEEALELARDDSFQAPAEWCQRTETMGRCPAKTYIAVLGAALLAKATDARVNALALQHKAGERAFNARNPAGLMWEYARRYRFDYGDTGSDPHQSRPWTNRPSVDDIPLDVPRRSDRKYLEYMVFWLQDLNQLDQREALGALAAYLRVRSKVYEENASGTQVKASAAALGLRRLASAVQSFVNADPEDGGRGQGAVAAAFTAAGLADTITKRIHDPNLIDVRVRNGGPRLLLGAEVKQKPVIEAVAADLASKVADADGDRALLCALAVRQRPLDRETIRQHADELGVVGLVAHSVMEVFEVALLLGRATRAEFLKTYPTRLAEALEHVGASVDGRRYWAALSEAWDNR